MKLLRNFLQEQQGSSIILVGFALLGLLAITGLVIDGGTLYMTKSHLQKAANAAVLSGAQELTNEESVVTEVVNKVLQAHQEEESLVETTIEMERKVSVHLKKEVSLAFVKIFGYESTPVKAIAAAEIMQMSKAKGVAPLGIEESIDLVYNEVYTLKFDGSDQGNFGALTLGERGADTYRENLAEGYQGYLQVGDIVQTEPGTMTGPTREGVKALLDSCPYTPGETHHRDCPRIILVPVYKEISDKGGRKYVEITGFAYFYILEPVNKHDKTIKGIFIKRAGSGFVDSGAVDKGAYGIRLTE